MALIAIDVDGPLLNYNAQFGIMWNQFFGEKLTIQEPRAYHATTYWGVSAPPSDHPFWDHFDKNGWLDMPAIEGSIEACKALSEAGHTLVCVTSMPTHREADRFKNLLDLGFPIDRVIATGHAQDPSANPKKAAIEALSPDWFIDDELRKLKHLPGVRCVLLDPGHPDSPNNGQENSYLEMTVGSMTEFAAYFLEMQSKPQRACKSF